MPTTIFAQNYRGFKELRIPLDKTIFLVGDNSSGKSSILHLINFVLKSDLDGTPFLNDELSIERFDFFSPYFDYANVTIGYCYSDEKLDVARLITLERQVNLRPKILRCTYASGDFAITLKKHGKGIAAKINRSMTLDVDKLIEFHNTTSGFRQLGSDTPDKATNSTTNAYFAISSLAPDLLKTKKIRDAIFEEPLTGARHIAPIRASPTKFYNFERKYKTSGAHFASMLQDMSQRMMDIISKKFEKFGSDSGLFESLEVKRISKSIPDSPLLVLVKRNGKQFFLTQVGVGVSQIVPVLVECLFCLPDRENVTVLMQQPELHLHPIAQAAVGEFVFETAVSGLPMVIETHSDFLIDRFRARMRDATSLPSSFGARILYCHNDRNGTGNMVEFIEIDRQGKLVDAPPQYQEFFLNEIMRTMF